MAQFVIVAGPIPVKLFSARPAACVYRNTADCAVPMQDYSLMDWRLPLFFFFLDPGPAPY